jgi:hypothetical protein
MVYDMEDMRNLEEYGHTEERSWTVGSYYYILLYPLVRSCLNRVMPNVIMSIMNVHEPSER